MKKGLSLILAIAMVFSMFASVAFAAETKTPEQMFEALKTKGIFNGIDDKGTPGLDKNMTRAQVSVVLVKLLNLTEDKAAASVFKDLDSVKSWAEGTIGAAYKADLMKGKGAGKFDPNGVFTTEQLAAVLVRALGIAVDANATVDGKVSDWAKGSVAAAIKAGLIQKGDAYNTAAPRSVLVSATYVADQSIESANKLTATVKQTGAKELTVTFNKAAAADVKVTVKSAYLTVEGKTEFAADRKSAVFTVADAEVFNAGDYTVEVTGVDPIAVKVEAAKLVSIKFTQSGLQAKAGNVVKYEGVDQFGKKLEIAVGDVNASAYNVTDGATVAVAAPTVVGELTLTPVLVKDKDVLISIITKTGVSAQTTVKVAAESKVATVKLGEVKPLKDKARIMQNNQGLVLPITLVDQYGVEMTLNNANETTLLAQIKLISSDTSVIDIDATKDVVDVTDKPSELRFNAKDKAGTVVITAFVPATAAQASTTVVVNGNAALKAVTLKQPTGMFVALEKIKAEFTAKDQYDAAFTLAKSDLYWVSTDNSVVDTTVNAQFNIVDGKLEIVPQKEGSVTISAFLNGALQGSLTFNVVKAAEVTKIKGLADGTVTKFVYGGGTYTYVAADFVIVDQYNRTLNKDHKLGLSNDSLTIAVKANAGDAVTVTDDVYDRTVVGANKTGETTLTASYAGKTFDFKVATVNARDVVKYEVTVPTITTIWSNASVDATDDYAAKFELKHGLDKDNNKVAVTPGFDNIVSSETNVKTSTVNGTVYSDTAVDGKEAVVIVFKNAQQIAQVTFKTSTAGKAPASVKFKDDVKKELDAAYNFGEKVEVKDQYGVAYAVNGKFYSSDAAVLTINADTGAATIPGTFSGEAKVTVSYVTTNAKIISVEVTVKK